MKLQACAGCTRHVRSDDASCPFCGASIVASVEAPRPRARRAVVFASAAALSLACGGSAAPAQDGGSPPEGGDIDTGAGMPFYGACCWDSSVPDAAKDAGKDAGDASVDSGGD